MGVNVYLSGDTGPSGFGVATRGILKGLLNTDDINVTCKTHFWGLNKEGIYFKNRPFPDTRFADELLRNGTINDDYLIEDPRELPERENVDITTNLDTNQEAASEECLIRQFGGEEDVWMATGSVQFAEQAPDDPYTIVSTDYNLDTVPRDWEYYVEQVDELWVPSEWTRQAVLNRIPDANVHTFPYGINMAYEPTEYDCHVCPHNQQGRGGPPQRCLRDDAFNFLVVSRFYHIKGIHRTLKAYIEEFRASDDVRLFIKTTSNNQFQFNPVQAAQQVVNDLGYPDPPEIGFATETMETQYLYDLFGHCDAFIQASRAECFGIAQMQAAYCETPVIYTNWSAQEELLPDREGFFPIDDYTVERPAQENPRLAFDVSASYPPDAQWATPDVETIQARMRELYEMDTTTVAHHGEQARTYVTDTFQWEDRMRPRVERLREVAT